MSTPEIDYPCVGVCMVDADSGYCLGCGRPPPSAGDDSTAQAQPAAAGATIGTAPQHSEADRN